MRHADQTLEPVRALLPEGWNVRKERSHSRAFNILDSYEGSLLLSGTAFLEFLENPVKIELLPEKFDCEISGPPYQKTFAPSALPISRLRDIIMGKAGPWLIGRLGRGTETATQYRIENENRQGVAHLYLRTFKCSGGPAATVALLIPYRGCNTETAALQPRIEAAYPPSSVPHALYDSLPDTVRRLSDPTPIILPTERSRKAVMTLLGYLLNRVRFFELGVLQDRDPEVLHRYRVSIRRMRSLVSLLKKAFLPEEREALRAELKSAMQDTNRLRDLDIHMAEMAGIRPSLPPSLQPGLDSVLKGLNAERRRQFRTVLGSLTAASFEERFSKVIAILGGHPEPDSETIADTLTFAILRRYRKIARETRALGEKIQPAQLHSLRVSCKKLRYLMDSFPQVLNQDAVAPLLKTLKKMQNLLGRYNDLSVMEKFLRDLAKRHHGNSAASTAIGSFAMHTHRERSDLAKRCVAEMRNFCSSGNKRRLKNAVVGNKD
jgi:CHAD domain-containing protein